MVTLFPSFSNYALLAYVQQPGVGCVDETTYCIDGIKYWVWVATSDQVCVILLAPTRSSAELKQLLGENFSGILSSDCFSAYGPQSAAAKQQCLAHLERDLEALVTSRLAANVDFAQKIKQVLWTARKAHQDYHAGLSTLEELQQKRPSVEAQLKEILARPPSSGWPADSQRLANRLERH